MKITTVYKNSNIKAPTSLPKTIEIRDIFYTENLLNFFYLN